MDEAGISTIYSSSDSGDPSHLRQEAVYLLELQDGFQAKRVIDNWIGFYNAERPHTALDNRTPDDTCFGTILVNQAA